MGIKSLHHASLVVVDLKKSNWFYGTVLGMAPAERPPNFTFEGSWFRAGNTDVHIITAADTTAPAGQPESGRGKLTGLATHFAFEVDDVYAMRQRIESFDWPIVSGPIPRGDGAYQLYVEDPDGYFIEFFQWIDSGAGVAERGAVAD